MTHTLLILSWLAVVNFCTSSSSNCSRNHPLVGHFSTFSSIPASSQFKPGWHCRHRPVDKNVNNDCWWKSNDCLRKCQSLLVKMSFCAPQQTAPARQNALCIPYLHLVCRCVSSISLHWVRHNYCIFTTNNYIIHKESNTTVEECSARDASQHHDEIGSIRRRQ
jgi:hypothetical protein